MRIARTTGVSEAIVKPRRGISLRTRREEPKPPEKVSLSIMTDWKVIQESASASGLMREVRALNDRLVQSMFVPSDLISNGDRTTTRVEELEESRVRHAIEGRIMSDMFGSTSHRPSARHLDEIFEYRFGPPLDGYTRTIDYDIMRDVYIAEDHRPRGVRRVVDETLEFSIPYEVIEDMDGMYRSDRRQYEQMPFMFWRAVARQCGHNIPPHFTHVEVHQEFRDRTFNVRFTTR